MSLLQARHLVLLAAALALTGCGGGGGGSGGVGESGGAGGGSPAAVPTGPSASELAAAAKILDRTTFGADYALIEEVARQGVDAWLGGQFLLPPSHHLPIVQRYLGEYGFDLNANPPPGTFRRFAWWERTLTAPDQLRQRVAYALTQIFVVSDNVDALAINPLGLASYYDTLLDHAFGNFRDLLRAVTLHPVMGVYLSHVNNGRSDPVQPGGVSSFGNTMPVLHVPMRMFAEHHEPGEKRLLNGTVVPAGRSGLEDIDAAIDNLFLHPNTGPFIGRLLIQRLVSSNPSPAYVARVAEAFAGDAVTPRGDLGSVIRAVLTDPEAAVGVRLREPFLRYVALNRGAGVTSQDGTFPGLGYVAQFLVQQHVLSAPSVFNFYLPDFSPEGELRQAGSVAPEFQITTQSTIVGMTNLLAYALFSEQSVDTPEGFSPIRLDLAEFEELAADPDALLNRIDLVFTGNTLDAATRSAIRDAIQPLGTDPIRAKLALYLALSAPDYAVAGSGENR